MEWSYHRKMRGDNILQVPDLFLETFVLGLSGFYHYFELSDEDLLLGQFHLLLSQLIAKFETLFQAFVFQYL